MMDISDEKLVERIQAGDEAASDELYGRYKLFVIGLSKPYFLMGGDRNDLLQEGMIGLFKAVRNYTPQRGMRFRSFAELCVRRQIYSAVEASNRQKHQPLNRYVSIDHPSKGEDGVEMPFGDRLPSNISVDPEWEIIAREEEERFEAFMEEALTDFERKVLDGFLKGLSYREMAESFGRSVKAVDNALQRIKKKAAEQLRRNGEE